MDLALLLCYFFPPIGGGGVQRSVKFAKYLPAFGWQPVIVAANANRRNAIEQGLDPTLLNDLNSETPVFRCRSYELVNLFYLLNKLKLRKALFEFERVVPFLYVDYKIGWYPTALVRAKHLVQTLPIKIIYSSSPPYSSHFIAYRLQQRYRIPWVADFRDPWTLLATYNPATRLNRYLNAKWESRIIHSANVIIANTNRNKDNLIGKYGIRSDKVHVIPNGFDPDDFKFRGNQAGTSGRFVISCLGRFYDMRNQDRFFEAYHRLHDRYRNVLLRFYGWQSRSIRNLLSSHLQRGSWEYYPERVTHELAVNVMRESNLLLANLPDENCTHWVPGKLYEYLAANNPILLIGPKDGDAADLLERTRTGKVVGFDGEEVYSALDSFYDQWSSGKVMRDRSQDEISRFERKVQTQKLAEIFATLKASSKH